MGTLRLDQRALLLLLRLMLGVWMLPERSAAKPSQPSSESSTKAQTRIRTQPAAQSTTKSRRRRIARKRRHSERVHYSLCIGHLRVQPDTRAAHPCARGRVQVRPQTTAEPAGTQPRPQSSRQRLLRIESTKSGGLCVQPRSSKGGT